MRFVNGLLKKTALIGFCLICTVLVSACGLSSKISTTQPLITAAQSIAESTTTPSTATIVTTTTTFKPTTAAPTAAPTVKPTIKPTVKPTTAATTAFTEPDKIHLPGVPPNDGFSGSQAMIDQFIGLVNALRTAPPNNLSTLSVGDSKLQDVAAIRAAEASVLWSHSRPTKDLTCDQWSDLFDALDVFPSRYIGENLAYNNDAADQAVQTAMDGLVASSGHLANMLNSNYKYIAIGVYKTSIGYYFSQEFAG